MYKPLALASSIVGGLIAGKIFTEIWQRANPRPARSHRSRWTCRSSAKEIFIAAAPLQGMIVGLVRASLARAQSSRASTR